MTIAQLQDYINTYIKANGRKAITGSQLNYLMLEFIDWVQTTTTSDVEDAIVNGVTDKSPSQNAVFDALALKQELLVSGTNIKTLNGVSLLGSGDLVTLNGGKFGIADANGIYTYYNSFQDAINAASAGQTVEMFADVTETGAVSVNLKNGVHINGNGHTYTLNNAGTANAIQDNASAINCKISNIIITRTGGTASSTNTLCMYITGASRIECFGVRLIGGTTNIRCLTINNASAEVFGVYAEGYNPTITVTNGTLYNSEARSINGAGIIVETNGRIIKCVGIGWGAQGIITSGICIDSVGNGLLNEGIVCTGGTLQNCVGYSPSSYGINLNTTGTSINCTGYSAATSGVQVSGTTVQIGIRGYSTAGAGIGLINGVLYDCIGFSSSTYGISMTNSGATISEIRKCQAISTAQAGLYQNNATSGSKIINSDIVSRWNNVAGHGIVLVGDNTEITGCSIRVVNASANCINAATSKTAKYSHNSFDGATTPVNANVSQGQTNAPDTYGNIKIG